MYYPCSENKGADQLRSYCEADLRLFFSHRQKSGFLMTRLFMILLSGGQWCSWYKRIPPHTVCHIYLRMIYDICKVHFLLECPAYTREREEFFYKINKLWNRSSFSSNFIARNMFQLFYLFNDNNLHSLKLFIKYVRNISDIRNLK